jgi:hypothetical protein
LDVPDEIMTEAGMKKVEDYSGLRKTFCFITPPAPQSAVYEFKIYRREE